MTFYLVNRFAYAWLLVLQHFRVTTQLVEHNMQHFPVTTQLVEHNMQHFRVTSQLVEHNMQHFRVTTQLIEHNMLLFCEKRPNAQNSCSLCQENPIFNAILLHVNSA